MSLVRKFNDKEKYCARCDRWLLHEFFGKRKVSRTCVSGLGAYCLVCERKYNRELDNHEERKGYLRKYRYGLDNDGYESLLTKQGNLCAICQEPKKLLVDHNHKTGQVRGLLCGHCNKVLGFLNEDTSLLEGIKRYLEKWPQL